MERLIPKESRLTPMVDNTALEHVHASFQSFNVPTGWHNYPPIAMLAWGGSSNFSSHMNA